MAGEQAIRETEAVQRRDEALKMRLQGASYAEIAKALNIGRTTAYEAVQGGLEEIRANYRETAEEVLALELERLNAMQMLCDAHVQNGDIIGVDRGLKVMERRARYLGLDAPTKIAPTDPTGESEYAGLSDEALRELAAKVAAQQATDGDA